MSSQFQIGSPEDHLQSQRLYNTQLAFELMAKANDLRAKLHDRSPNKLQTTYATMGPLALAQLGSIVLDSVRKQRIKNLEFRAERFLA